MRKIGFIATAVATVAMVGASFAQPGRGSSVGEITALEGPVGSVLIVRGNQTYSLSVGDKLFPGDQVWTRTNGKVSLKYYTCTANLNNAESITVAQTCAAAAALPVDGSVGNVAVAATTGGTAAGVPAVLATVLGLAGVAALSQDSSKK